MNGPNVNKDLLMEPASDNCTPFTLVLPIASLPAKSTQYNCPILEVDVDKFLFIIVQAIVLQAKKRVGSTRSLASNVVGELDEWIGSVVAAETASVGLMRKSMSK